MLNLHATCIRQPYRTEDHATANKEQVENMLKVMLLFCCIWMAIDGQAIAEIYKCTDTQGEIIYTDDPVKLPRECNPGQAVKLPTLNVFPAQSTPPMPRAAGSPGQTAGSRTQQGDDTNSFTTFDTQARDLVDRYGSTRQKATFAPLFRDKEAAKGELRSIQSEKHTLVNAVEQSSLERSQKDQIMEKLSQIPD